MACLVLLSCTALLLFPFLCSACLFLLEVHAFSAVQQRGRTSIWDGCSAACALDAALYGQPVLISIMSSNCLLYFKLSLMLCVVWLGLLVPQNPNRFLWLMLISDADSGGVFKQWVLVNSRAAVRCFVANHCRNRKQLSSAEKSSCRMVSAAFCCALFLCHWQKTRAGFWCCRAQDVFGRVTKSRYSSWCTCWYEVRRCWKAL